MKKLKTTAASLSLSALCFTGLSLAGDQSPEAIARSLIERLTSRVNADVVEPLSPGTPWTMRFSRALPFPEERIYFEVPDAFTKAGGTSDRIPFTIYRENLRAKVKNPKLKPQRVVGGHYDPKTDEIVLDDAGIEKFIAMKKKLKDRKLEEVLSSVRHPVRQIEEPGESDT